MKDRRGKVLWHFFIVIKFPLKYIQHGPNCRNNVTTEYPRNYNKKISRYYSIVKFSFS